MRKCNVCKINRPMWSHKLPNGAVLYFCEECFRPYPNAVYINLVDGDLYEGQGDGSFKIFKS
jgi:hypothetical protein